jgi:hypothetical protein
VEIENLGRENHTLYQEARALKCQIQDKDQELLTLYGCSSEHDQKLTQYRRLLHDAEQASLIKAQEIEDL